MAESDIPEHVRHFIFENIESVEQLEVLFFLRQNSHSGWTNHAISQELRSSPISVANRLLSLKEMHLLSCHGDEFQYSPASIEMSNLIDELHELYKRRRQTILKLIFSPTKRARSFADAFLMSKNGKKGD